MSKSKGGSSRAKSRTKQKATGIHDFVAEYEKYLQSSFQALWAGIRLEADKLDAYAVVGALLSRQVTLSNQLARCPNAWNGHSAPLFLRAMVDLYITLAWILKDFEERAKKYILYGLGEEKLAMERYKQDLEADPSGPNAEQIRELVRIKERWINAQRRDFFVEVNLGNWSQLDVRRMAQEADCEGLYNFAYKPFSAAAHSTWPHVAVYNAKPCMSPLHKYHLIPTLFDAELDSDFLFRSCKYVDKTYHLLKERFSVTDPPQMPLEWWASYIDQNFHSDAR